MKFKMTVLYSSKSGNAEILAQSIARDQKTKSDKIPPAYPCEAQKLVFIGLELEGAIDKQVKSFCQDLTPQRTKNVAFFVTNTSNSTDKLQELKDILKKNGGNVVDDVHVCPVKKILFKAGRIKQNDVADAVKWASNLVDSMA